MSVNSMRTLFFLAILKLKAIDNLLYTRDLTDVCMIKKNRCHDIVSER